jgi:hypothetical protein
MSAAVNAALIGTNRLAEAESSPAFENGDANARYVKLFGTMVNRGSVEIIRKLA